MVVVRNDGNDDATDTGWRRVVQLVRNDGNNDAVGKCVGGFLELGRRHGITRGADQRDGGNVVLDGNERNHRNGS